MIESAFDNKEELEKTIKELLDKKLVCSCQVVKSNSQWRWNGELESAKEFLIFMKTKRTLVNDIYEVIKQIHSYNCFEFAIFPLDSCNNDYLKWIDNETK